MKKSMSSLNVKKKILVKSILFGCAILCPTLISVHSASAMLKTYTDPSLSDLEFIKKIENLKNKEKAEQEKQKKYKQEYKEERESIESTFIDSNPLTNVIPIYSLSPDIDGYHIGNYPKEEFIEEAQNICQETNKKIGDLLDQGLDQNGEEFQNKKRELELDCQIKANLLQKRIDQYNQQEAWYQKCLLI